MVRVKSSIIVMINDGKYPYKIKFRLSAKIIIGESAIPENVSTR